MAKKITSKTARREYIKLLEKFSEIKGSPIPDPNHEEKILSIELLNGLYLKGQVVQDDRQCKDVPHVSGITVKGRLFLQELQEQEKQDSLWQKALKYLPVLFGYVVGLLTPFIQKWLESVLATIPK